MSITVSRLTMERRKVAKSRLTAAQTTRSGDSTSSFRLPKDKGTGTGQYSRHYALAALLLGLTATPAAFAHDIQSEVDPNIVSAFDITAASIVTDNRLATFAMEVAGIAGSEIPAATGQFEGSRVAAYVWPTSLSPLRAGFKTHGILALALTAHHDFDDTPLFDENDDGDLANDGANWHTHWVVLTNDFRCGAGLKVKDISPGRDLNQVLPPTAPGVPIALDSPGMTPLLNGGIAEVTVPLRRSRGARFDAVTAELQVNEEGAAPLLCVDGVHDIASGNLSFPGVIAGLE